MTATVLPGQETLLACWETLARSSPGATVVRSSAADAAVFPSWTPMNNAILTVAGGDAPALAASDLAKLYVGAGVAVWALWVPSRALTFAAPDAVRAVGDLRRDETTLVMRATIPRGLRPHDAVVPSSIAAVARLAGDETVSVTELGEPERSPSLAAWAVVDDDVAVACAYTFLHERDCGIYAVGTLPRWRRRGIARSLLKHVLADAAARGARTASLQSTAMARGLYESFGFTVAGRYEEWISR